MRSRAAGRSLKRVDVRRSDLLVVLALLGLGAFGIFLAHDVQPDEVRSLLPMWGDYLALAFLLAPLVFRRRSPLTVGLMIGLGFTAFRLLKVPEGPMSSVAVFVALHAVGAFSDQPRRRDLVRSVVIGTGMIALVAALLDDAEFVNLDSLTFVLFSVGLNVAFFVAAWMLGDATRERTEDEVELRRRADELAAEREERARQAVTTERVRIARELHDVVAHHVSVMGVQASAARRMLDRDSAKAAEALGYVEESGRQAVSELQRLVGFLRSERDDERLAPQPTLDGLPKLIETTRTAGLPVELRTIGHARSLPSSVELSAYRIVQEALTNVVRHAPGAPTTVVLSYLPDALQVEIVNGPAAAGATVATGPGGGRGLVGMRERAAVLEGRFEHGPTTGGGYRVVARLPNTSGYEGDVEAAQ